MRPTPRKRAVEFIVNRRVPDFIAFRRPELTQRFWINRSIPERERPAFTAKIKEQAESVRSDLAKLDDEEFASVVHEESEIADQEMLEEFAEIAELPLPADTDHYSRLAFWNLDEMAALSFGYSPLILSLEILKQEANWSDFALEYARVRELIDRAISNFELSPTTPPLQFIQWAARLEIQLPADLIELVKRRAPEDQLAAAGESARSSRDEISGLAKSPYWRDLKRKATKAINEFPEWQQSQRLIQKTGNLIEWLVEEVGADNREAEVIKKVLTDTYPNAL